MKAIVASAITAVAVVLGGCHAGPRINAAPDQRFIANLKSYGMQAPPGLTESQWEAMAISSGHNVCTLLGQGVITRDEINSGDTSSPFLQIRTLDYAAIDVYCPQFKQ
jgi:hypothetical protein